MRGRRLEGSEDPFGAGQSVGLRFARPWVDLMCQGCGMLRRRPPLSALVAKVLDPVFTATPFQPGQTGERAGKTLVDPGETPWPPGPAQVIWCAPYQDLRESQPGLPQAHDQDDDDLLACVDVTISFGVDGDLSQADVGQETLADTFALLGMDQESHRAAGLTGRQAEESCPALAELIAKLFSGTARPGW